MAKYIFPLIIALTCTAFAARGEEIQSAAGQLSALIENPAEIADLTISGSVNAADLDFIDTSMPALRSLNLANVAIEAYANERVKVRLLANHAANTVPAHIFAGSKLQSVILPATANLTIGDAAFAGSDIQEITIGSNVVAMGSACFNGCPELTKATIATAVVGEGAFAACPKLATVVVASETPVELGDYSFSDCPALVKIDGAANVKSIGRRAFVNCAGLGSFDFGEPLTSIGDESFLRAGLVSADLAPCVGLANVGDWSFAQMPHLESLNLGSAAKVGKGVVFECPELVNLVCSTADTSIPDYAFVGDTRLDTAGIIHDELAAIGRFALSGLTQVTTISLPATLESLGDNAMERMTGLQSIAVDADRVPELGENVWEGVDQANVVLNVPQAAAEDYRQAEQWKEFIISNYSAVDETIADEIADCKIAAMFDGDNLVVRIIGADADLIGLYDLAGVQLASARPEGEFTVFDTSAITADILIVAVRLADGKLVSLKIAKI